jgi:hypothetical protein
MTQFNSFEALSGFYREQIIVLSMTSACNPTITGELTRGLPSP